MPGAGPILGKLIVLVLMLLEDLMCLAPWHKCPARADTR